MKSRTISSMKNMATGIGGQFLSLILGFVNRSIFISILGITYLGISGLFSSVLIMLSLAELGVGTAIIYSLYKPLAENDEDKILALMNLYKKVYHIIGICILAFGLILTPFIQYLIKEDPGIANLKLIFFMFVFQSSISYFFSYNRSLIVADQKAYKLIWIDTIYTLINVFAPLVILFVTRNYLFYIAVKIITDILRNLIVYFKVAKAYPVLKSGSKPKLDEETKHQLKKNITALIIYKLAMVFSSGSGNIVISKFVGIAATGLYANYYLIISSLTGILNQALNSLVASIGNLSATENDDKKYDIFKVIQFMNFWIYGFSSICLFVLMNPFIELWLGAQYLFDINSVFAIVFGFYLLGMQGAVSTFRDAQGIFWQGKLRPLFQAIINIGASIALVKITNDVSGVFWGTIISRLTTCFWFDPYIVHKHGFHKPLASYFGRYGIYTSAVFFSGAVVYWLSRLFAGTAVINLIIGSALCLIIPNLVFFLCFSRTKEFKYMNNTARHLITKGVKKLKNKS